MILALLTACFSRYDFDGGELEKRRKLVHGGIERRYAQYTSSSPGPRPLVVLLHGGGATLNAFLADPGGASPMAAVWLQLADDEGFHLVIPQGIDKHWNDCRTDCETGCREDIDDAAFLMALIDTVSSEIDVDPDRIHVTGESNGGMMTQRMAREHTDRLASVGVVIAAIPANNECGDPSGPLPIQYIVGTEDQTMPWDGGGVLKAGEMRSAADTIGFWTTLNGCTGEPTVEELDDRDPQDGTTVQRQTWTCTAADVVRYRVQGGGHVAPSLKEQTSAGWNLLVGAQSHDLETADATWNFFEAHPRGAPANGSSGG